VSGIQRGLYSSIRRAQYAGVAFREVILTFSIFLIVQQTSVANAVGLEPPLILRTRDSCPRLFEKVMANLKNLRRSTTQRVSIVNENGTRGDRESTFSGSTPKSGKRTNAQRSVTPTTKKERSKTLFKDERQSESGDRKQCGSSNSDVPSLFSASIVRTEFVFTDKNGRSEVQLVGDWTGWEPIEMSLEKGVSACSVMNAPCPSQSMLQIQWSHIRPCSNDMESFLYVLCTACYPTPTN
jgi:hypothetical protein